MASWFKHLAIKIKYFPFLHAPKLWFKAFWLTIWDYGLVDMCVWQRGWFFFFTGTCPQMDSHGVFLFFCGFLMFPLLPSRGVVDLSLCLWNNSQLLVRSLWHDTQHNQQKTRTMTTSHVLMSWRQIIGHITSTLILSLVLFLLQRNFLWLSEHVTITNPGLRLDLCLQPSSSMALNEWHG